MSGKTALILAVVVLVAGWLVLSLVKNDQPPQNQLQQLARQQAVQQAERQLRQSSDLTETESVDDVQRAKQGFGQPVPKELVYRLRSDGYWVVGKEKHEAGAGLPFAPGRIPRVAEGLQPVSENPGFLGADACRDCHQEKYETFVQTAHHLTSQPATAAAIKGPFQPGHNVMRTRDPHVRFTMIDEGDQCVQRVNFFNWHFDVPFAIVAGSSKMAQTYFYWHRDRLFQMHVTYLSEVDDWINSPGFIDGDADFARPIRGRCIECHVTYVDFREAPNHYTPGSMIFGISCERCHGPGKPHVEYHRSHPQEKEPRFTTVPSDLPRHQELAICGQCHSGAFPLKAKPFAFRPGDLLDQHYDHIDEASLDGSVHTSDQAARLAKSECFQQSEMTCSDCHNPHRNERGDRMLQSSRCLTCHQSEHCGMSAELGPTLTDNCIDCHMPVRSTKNLRFETERANVFPFLRDHHIRIDRRSTEEFLARSAAEQ